MVKQDLNTRFGKKVQQYFDTCCIVSPFVHCDYNYKSDNCITAHRNRW